MLEDYQEERLCVTLVGSIDDTFQPYGDMIGFVAVKGDHSCFLRVGTLDEANEIFEDCEEDLLVVFLHCLLKSGDEMAIEFSDLVRGLEDGIYMDGNPISVFLLEKALAKIGHVD